MSQENVKIMRQAFAAFGKHGIDALIDYYSEDCVCEELADMPDSTTQPHSGREGVRRRFERLTGTWEDFVAELVELIDAGEDIVISVFRVRARSRDSEIPVESSVAFVHEFRDGQVVRDRVFGTKAEALEVAGLRE